MIIRAVYDVMRRLWFLLGVLLLASTSLAQNAPPATATALVPVVGNIPGINAQWKTDIEFLNDTGAPVDVAVELPLAPESPVLFLTLAPGQRQRFTDLLGQLFAIDGVISPLRVVTGGRRSVSLFVNVYGVQGTDVSPLQAIPVQYVEAFYPTRVLDNLVFSDDYRTNVGIVNLSERDAEFVLALQRIPGRIVAISRIRVGANSMIHSSVQSLFPLITKGSGFSIVVETVTPQTLAYASVVHNETNAGRFVSARIGSR